MMAFTGFPVEALQFYADIAQHNDRAWFEAHRETYMTHVIEPAQAFINTLGEALQAVAPGVGYDPNHTGRGSFKKIHTDQRFQKGRDPFKTYAQMIFWKGPLPQKKANAVFGVTIKPDTIALFTGLKYFDGKGVKAYRAAAADPTRGKALGDIVKTLKAQGYGVGDVHYKRVPRGYDPEHPNAELLRHNAIYATHSGPVPDAFHSAAFVDWCLDHFKAMAPIFEWSVALLERAASAG
jgi:uncharacterized protein (TIGR02453 family)